MDILLQILIFIEPLSFYIKKFEIGYIILFSVISIIYLKRNNNIKFALWETPLKFYFLFLVTSMISELILFITNKEVFKLSFSPYSRVVIYFLIMITIINISKTKDIFKKIISTVIISSIIPSFVAIIQLKYDVFTIINSLEGQRRLGSTFDHPNFYAFFLVIVIICLFYEIEKAQNGLKKSLLYLYTFLSIILLVFTYARTPLFALVGIIIIYLFRYVFFNGRQKYLKIVTICFALLFFTLSVYYVLHSEIFVTSRFNISTTENSGSFTWRLGKWNSSLMYWLGNVKNILIGSGWVTAREFGTNLAYKGYDMHNEILRIIFDTGVIGFAFYFSYFVSVIKYSININLDKAKRKFIFNLTVVLVLGCSNDNILIVPESCIVLIILLVLTYANTLYWNRPE